ncbi:ABC transporter ATP-binding protein [Planococcus versutus]|uniref:ABC transporter ATP-binding protein n=1 Tax=Planococcus versutus TaxID=1302659 RepID=A0A1B1S1H1_9BACL|nr:ATP-binding cassette domain-containing protein [Planococcus versutus]ANU27031.1 ABC transporter ATP-binding protein [Planococcus versutus]
MDLVIKELHKSFNDKHVLKGINLTINSGQIFGYLGRNGTGKTTSMRILMDVFEGDSGSILMDGKEFKPTDHRIGYLPEERGMYSKFKVKDQLVYFAELRGASKKEAQHSMEKWAEEFGIAIYLDQKLETLSKGNQQKVQIAQAFICEPDILILDEPFSGLDPVNSKMFQDSLLNYIREDRIIIFSSHQMGYIESFCDDIAIINGGKIVLSGDLNDIRKEMGEGKLRLRVADPQHLDFLTAYDYTMEKEDIILTLHPNETKRSFVEGVFSQGIELTMFMEYLPSLQEIFIEKTGDQNEKT